MAYIPVVLLCGRYWVSHWRSPISAHVKCVRVISAKNIKLTPKSYS